MHLGLLLTVRLTELSLGVLLVHLVVFDVGWLRRRAAFSGQRKTWGMQGPV